jgi:hypothetical protein
VFLEAIARLRNDEKERCVDARQYDRPVSSEPWFVDRWSVTELASSPSLYLYLYASVPGRMVRRRPSLEYSS